MESGVRLCELQEGAGCTNKLHRSKEMLGGDNASGNRLLNNRLADLCQSATRHSGFDSLLVPQSYLDHPDTVAAPLRRDQTAGWFLQLPCGIVHVSPAARTPPCRRCSMHRPADPGTLQGSSI